MWNSYGPFDFIHGLGLLVVGFFWLIALAVIVAVLVLLVRFLLVATRAARLYVEKNSPTAPVTPAAPASPAPTTVTPTTPVEKPDTKPRTPKAPPAV